MKASDEPRLDWTVVLRRQPLCIVDGKPEGGYTDAYEIICCYCGDHPDVDYRDVSPGLQQIRGPYPIAAGVAAYERHVKRHHGGQSIHRSRYPVLGTRAGRSGRLEATDGI